MAKHFLEPAGDHVIVVDNPREVSIGEIDLPGNVRQQDMCYGTVVFRGPLVQVAKHEDTVCYGPYAGKTVVIEGIEFRILREGQIEAYVREKVNDD
jgi:co-chaperonin GroES (HSP10)